MNDNSRSSAPSVESQKCTTFRLRYARSHFDVGQQAGHDSQTQSTSLIDTFAVGTKQSNIQSHEFLDSLGLTGTIISATAYIPYVVSRTTKGKFKIDPRPAKTILEDVLTDLSKSSAWNHTLVGWTGKVLPIRSAKLDSSVSDDNGNVPIVGLGRQSGDPGVENQCAGDFDGMFLQQLDSKKFVQQKVTVSKKNRRELEGLLEHVSDNKIVPVWMGEWADDERDILDLKDQDRWQIYAKNYLLKGLNGEVAESSQFEEQAFRDYREMNESFADAIVEVYNPGDIVWVHDYHLMLLPDILRRRIPSAYIAYFHYADWADKLNLSEVFGFKEAATGILGASVIGLPTDNIRQRAEDYLSQAMKLEVIERHVLRNEKRIVQLLSVPPGIDMKNVLISAFQDSKVNQSLETIMHRYANKKRIVFCVCNHGRGGLSNLLNGFETFLNTYRTEFQDTVLFLVTAPTSYHLHKSAGDALDLESSRRIVAINDRFGTLGYQPIVQVQYPLPRYEYLALLRSADLGVITGDCRTAVSTGTDFVACQQDGKSPLLIAERQPRRTLFTVDPSSDAYEARELAAKLREALSLDNDTKGVEHEFLLNYFASSNITRFNTDFIAQASASFATFAPFKDVPSLDEDVLSVSFTSANYRLLMFDYDGTLTPIVNDPDAALPSNKLLSALNRLAAEAKNKVWIISGRSRTFLEKHFGNIHGLGLSAEHGSFIRNPGAVSWNNLAASMDMGWKAEASIVFQEFVDQIEGSWIERKEVAMVWHYRNAVNHDACLAKAVDSKARLEGNKLKSWDVEVMLGKANVEVRPRFLNKGNTATGLIEETFDNQSSGFTLCAGDDVTDEDMFRALLSSKLDGKDVFSCLVSKTGRPSLANYRIPEPADLVDMISMLSSL